MDDTEHHTHGSRRVERYTDVAVIGASVAGLAAALTLARERRSVIVVDAGEPADAPGEQPTDHDRESVRAHGVEVLSARAAAVTRRDGGRFRVELTGGHAVVARRVLAATDIDVDPDIDADGSAADAGARVGAAIGADLDRDDLHAGARRSANEPDWDRRYGGEQVWSGNPNGTLVAEVAGMAPGRALDVGAGEGGDAIWLAEQGWQVAAADISGRALDRVAAAARERGVPIELVHADANAVAPFESGAFDLVSAQYASIPRTPDGRGVANLLDAVAPGGTLLVVSHDIEPMRSPVDTHHDSRPFDADAYVRVDDVAAAVGAGGWVVEVHETRPRPPGAATAHHVDDVVLRARRLT